MAGHVVVCDKPSILCDDHAAADRLGFHLAAFRVICGDDVNAHQGGLDLVDGRIHSRAEFLSLRNSGGERSAGCDENDEQRQQAAGGPKLRV